MSEAPQAAVVSAPQRGGGWFAMVIVGSILTVVSAGMLAGGLALAGAVTSHADGGFVTSPAAGLSTSASAVTSPPALIETSLDRDSFPRITVSLAVASRDDAPVFVGIGPSADVKEYLADVHTARLDGMRGNTWELQTRDVPGTAAPEPPASQSFWAVADSGPGTREIQWNIEPGDWTVVIMNADGSSGIDTTVRAGVEAPWAAPVATALTAVAASLLVIGLALIVVGVLGWGRGRAVAIEPIRGPYPVSVVGELGMPSRGLWLVKWILAIPHWVVLALLWVAFVVATIIAGFAILFTGRYPRSIFEFTVGVLRWSWRVSFYAYSALGTDQYPPFSLERRDYPADLVVEYPEHLSHGLVLVKSWLLALPHLLIVGAITGTAAWGAGWVSRFGASVSGGVSLLGLLVLVAALILLFTGRYQRPLFDLIMGLNRWALRVAVYTSLMRDEYPPFRLDQGSAEPPVAADRGTEAAS